MMTKNQISEQIKAHLMPQCFNAAVKAGAAIMKIYKNIDDYDISLKSDHTPITIADRVAHTTIKEFLGSTRIPVLSEEGREMHYDERRNWDLFFLVDPLDGTVEFIKGNNEFTVNIALMSDNRCVTSVLYVPYHRKMYLAFKGHGAYLINNIEPDDNPTYDYARISSMMQRLPLESTRHDHLRVARARTRHPRPSSRSTAYARHIPIWRSSSRAAPTSSACWPRVRSTITFARPTPTNGTPRPES